MNMFSLLLNTNCNLPGRSFENPGSDIVLDFIDSVLELLHDSLSLQRINGETVGLCRHNDECDHSDGRVVVLEASVKAWELDEHFFLTIFLIYEATTHGRETQ